LTPNDDNEAETMNASADMMASAHMKPKAKRATATGLGCAVFVAVLLGGASRGESTAWASSKEECLEAHSRGQDMRDAGRLTTARQAFMACAQTSCPQLIQADCARFGEELERLVPTVSFAARDPNGGDLPDTVVYVDDQPVAMRLDEGKAYDLDPGRHAVRFVHEGRETTVTVVLTQGDKARSVIATFADLTGPGHTVSEPAPAVVQPHRPVGPLLVAGIGAAAAVTGIVLTIVGLKQVPDDCSVGSHQCVAAPGDPSFDQAHRGVTMANFGVATGIGGAALLAGGAIWYFAQPLKLPKEVGGVAPWLGDRSGGVSVRAKF
jgi:hypothetical protein